MIMLPEKKLLTAARVKIVDFIGKSINELLKKKNCGSLEGPVPESY
jgi:hypothetical protein